MCNCQSNLSKRQYRESTAVVFCLLEFGVSLSAAPAVRTERAGDILVVTLDHPPVNALNVEVRRGLLQAVQQAQADAQVRAVLIVGAGVAGLAAIGTSDFSVMPGTVFTSSR